MAVELIKTTYLVSGGGEFNMAAAKLGEHIFQLLEITFRCSIIICNRFNWMNMNEMFRGLLFFMVPKFIRL